MTNAAARPVTAAYEARIADGRLIGDPAQRAVLPALDGLAVAMSAPPPAERSGGLIGRLFGAASSPAPQAGAPRGIYLWGGVGRGKSMLMDLMMDTARTGAKRRVHFHAFMQEVHAGLNAARARGDQDAVRPVAEAIAARTRLFCFDEMQITDIADAMIVGRLFQVLFDRGVSVVTTSNRPPEDLYKDGLNRALFLPFIDLIRERMQVLRLGSERDYRQDRMQGGQVWFSPDDAAARRALDGIWDELTGGAEPAPRVLAVGGRQLGIPAAGRVGRSSFADLCGQPLGPADYLAIADAFDTLILDAIPRLGPQNHDQARRFVTLIDALYEARVRLIASAADAPEQLYATGRGSFEFERTASRLQEMRDAGWGTVPAG
ncbi:cell division protein ZapE [Paracoccus contaminans]|uniref:Cell division protein ZapE n=1 Tax=Paracoccus contaminans TaxID=1945662 RepID=A0A1W6CV66_9RHOB|nr:cell division protein ZapE [Paracoccus contaminans]ARJ68768.1 cell division protein ZapE [Paracoccus contaminans]